MWMHSALSEQRLKLAAACLVLVSAMLLSLASCSSGSYSGERDSIVIGSAPLESSALIYIAEDQGFFEDNGLDVTVKDYETGAASLKGMIDGEVDIATPAEYALAAEALKKQDVSSIATIDQVQYFFLVGRKDRGIENISDLKGKKIGVVTKTTAEFYLGRLLELNGMDLGQVTLVDIKIPQSEEIILSGEVDAIVTRPPYAGTIEEKLGDNSVVWPAQSNQALYAVLVAGNDWITEHSDAVKRLFESLERADEYVLSYPDESMAIVQERLPVGEGYVESVWSQNQFSLRLDQSLVVAMEDQARWMMSNDLTAERQMPDFLDYIRDQELREIKPEAVNIIR